MQKHVVYAIATMMSNIRCFITFLYIYSSLHFCSLLWVLDAKSNVVSLRSPHLDSAHSFCAKPTSKSQIPDMHVPLYITHDWEAK